MVNGREPLRPVDAAVRVRLAEARPGVARWRIPAIVPAALTPADRVRESRIELADPYVVVLFPGALLALALCVTSLATAPHARRLTVADPTYQPPH